MLFNSNDGGLRELTGSFPSLLAVGNASSPVAYMDLDIYNNSALKTIRGAFPLLTAVEGRVYIDNNGGADDGLSGSIIESSFNSLTRVGGSLVISNYPSLARIANSFTALENIGGDFVFSNNYGELEINNSFPSLRAVTGNVQLLDIMMPDSNSPSGHMDISIVGGSFQSLVRGATRRGMVSWSSQPSPPRSFQAPPLPAPWLFGSWLHSLTCGGHVSAHPCLQRAIGGSISFGYTDRHASWQTYPGSASGPVHAVVNPLFSNLGCLGLIGDGVPAHQRVECVSAGGTYCAIYFVEDSPIHVFLTSLTRLPKCCQNADESEVYPCTDSPTVVPTAPTAAPSSATPSEPPFSATPSESPTGSPTPAPTGSPATSAPTATPSSAAPTRAPTGAPTVVARASGSGADAGSGVATALVVVGVVAAGIVFVAAGATYQRQRRSAKLEEAGAAAADQGAAAMQPNPMHSSGGGGGGGADGSNRDRAAAPNPNPAAYGVFQDAGTGVGVGQQAYEAPVKSNPAHYCGPPFCFTPTCPLDRCRHFPLGRLVVHRRPCICSGRVAHPCHPNANCAPVSR